MTRQHNAAGGAGGGGGAASKTISVRSCVFLKAGNYPVVVVKAVGYQKWLVAFVDTGTKTITNKVLERTSQQLRKPRKDEVHPMSAPGQGGVAPAANTKTNVVATFVENNDQQQRQGGSAFEVPQQENDEQAEMVTTTRTTAADSGGNCQQEEKEQMAEEQQRPGAQFGQQQQYASRIFSATETTTTTTTTTTTAAAAAAQEEEFLAPRMLLGIAAAPEGRGGEEEEDQQHQQHNKQQTKQQHDFLTLQQQQLLVLGRTMQQRERPPTTQQQEEEQQQRQPTSIQQRTDESCGDGGDGGTMHHFRREAGTLLSSSHRPDLLLNPEQHRQQQQDTTLFSNLLLHDNKDSSDSSADDDHGGDGEDSLFNLVPAAAEDADMAAEDAEVEQELAEDVAFFVDDEVSTGGGDPVSDTMNSMALGFALEHNDDIYRDKWMRYQLEKADLIESEWTVSCNPPKQDKKDIGDIVHENNRTNNPRRGVIVGKQLPLPGEEQCRWIVEFDGDVHPTPGLTGRQLVKKKDPRIFEWTCTGDSDPENPVSEYHSRGIAGFSFAEKFAEELPVIVSSF